MSSTHVIEEYFDTVGTLSRTLDRQPIADAIDMIYDAWRSGSAVYIIGNGGSASTATHFASDLAKYTIAPGKPRLRALSLVDNIPLISAWTNDSGFASIYAEQLDPWLQAGDVLIAISVHGGSGTGEAGAWSQNLLRAVSLAHERGAKVVGLSGFDGGALKELADACIVIPADSEPLGTPIVESYHVAVHHLICAAVKIRIAQQGADESDMRAVRRAS